MISCSKTHCCHLEQKHVVQCWIYELFALIGQYRNSNKVTLKTTFFLLISVIIIILFLLYTCFSVILYFGDLLYICIINNKILENVNCPISFPTHRIFHLCAKSVYRFPNSYFPLKKGAPFTLPGNLYTFCTKLMKYV